MGGEAQLWNGLTIGLTVHGPHKARMEHSHCNAPQSFCTAARSGDTFQTNIPLNAAVQTIDAQSRKLAKWQAGSDALSIATSPMRHSQNLPQSQQALNSVPSPDRASPHELVFACCALHVAIGGQQRPFKHYLI